MTDTRDYYNQLSPYNDLIHDNWEKNWKQHGKDLDSLIRQFWGADARAVLDAACGIGTQVLGLAALGYQMVGVDIAERAVERARQEAARRGFTIEAHVGDMRDLDALFPHRQFDVVIACDNAVSHLMTDDDLLRAYGQFFRRVRSGGGVIISVRDYAAMQMGGTQLYPREVHDRDGVRYVLYDVWEFSGSRYLMTTYLTIDTGQPVCQTYVQKAWLNGVTIDQHIALFERAGFVGVQRLDDRFFQPVIVATRP